MLKQDHPRLIVAQFWHIPWPNREIFRTFPWGEAILDGLLGNDLLGFHAHYHCQNFVDTVNRQIEARVDADRFAVHRDGHTTLVRPFPISIDYEAHDRRARSSEVQALMERWRRELNLQEEFVGVGIERLDYTKGIPERIRGLDFFFETHYEFRGRVRFIQVVVPSRSQVPAYQQIAREVDETVLAVNNRWRTEDWEPVTYIKEHQRPMEMMALHRLAQFCIVSSLHDGMNLVAKEFVASRHDEDGVLILSQFTGSALELGDAVLVNPFSIAEIAEAVHSAISMPQEERRRRMARMRAQVERNNVYRWAGRVLSSLLKFDFPEASEWSPAEVSHPADALQILAV
jgi:trehalose 6-phosphate synthase